MRILFVTSEHPAFLQGGLGTFTREYVRELRKYCDVKCVYFHLREGHAPEPDETVDFVLTPGAVFEAFSPEACILESAANLRAQLEPLLHSFKPDVIHCNDRQTFMPFRFDRNVFYSSHLIFTDLISNGVLDDLYFQEVKVERCAMENSAIVAAYSDFAAKAVEKLAGIRCTPLVLPLGISTDKLVLEENLIQKHKNGKLKVCYFGRFENIQKGLNDFIYAVNVLGPQFKKRNNIEYHLYGRGTVDAGFDLSLFEKPEFLEGEALWQAYRNADIVVMPSRYEPFGLTGLEAMAAGCLLLVTGGLGMDEYAEPGRNCLRLPGVAYEMVNVIRDAVLDFDKYDLVRENAVRTAKAWTWERCVKSHMYFYRLLMNGKISELCSAYRKDVRTVLGTYEKSNDVEKIFCEEYERIAFTRSFNSLCEEDKRKNVLVLTGGFMPDSGAVPENVKVVSVMKENGEGVVVRPECLPFCDKKFDVCIAAGGWESVLDPCGALAEIKRVSREKVVVNFRLGNPLEWQTFQMEDEKDWKTLNDSGWNLAVGDIDEENGYGTVQFTKVAREETLVPAKRHFREITA